MANPDVQAAPAAITEAEVGEVRRVHSKVEEQLLWSLLEGLLAAGHYDWRLQVAGCLETLVTTAPLKDNAGAKTQFLMRFPMRLPALLDAAKDYGQLCMGLVALVFPLSRRASNLGKEIAAIAIPVTYVEEIMSEAPGIPSHLKYRLVLPMLQALQHAQRWHLNWRVGIAHSLVHSVVPHLDQEVEFREAFLPGFPESLATMAAQVARLDDLKPVMLAAAHELHVTVRSIPTRVAAGSTLPQRHRNTGRAAV